MANATARTKLVNDGVTLTLTKDEAETLRLVTRYIGGSEFDTPRKHTTAIAHALASAGVSLPATKYAIEGALHFKAAKDSNPFRFDPYTMTSSHNAYSTRSY